MIELLEGRKLFSVASYAPGLVNINGSNAADIISVTSDGTGIKVTGTAGTATFASARVIYIFANGGDDTVTLDDSIKAVSIIYGGSGNDNLTAGGGNDIVNGESGNDKVHGGSGSDQVIGGSGADEVWGDGGLDFISTSGDKTSDKIHRDSADYLFKDKNDVVL